MRGVGFVALAAWLVGACAQDVDVVMATEMEALKQAEAELEAIQQEIFREFAENVGDLLGEDDLAALDEEQAEESFDVAAKLMIIYETVVETFQGDQLVDSYTIRGTQDLPLTSQELAALLTEDGEFDPEGEFSVMVSITRTSEVMIAAAIVLCIMILIGLLVLEQYQEGLFSCSDDEQDSDSESESEEIDLEENNLTEPLTNGEPLLVKV